MPEDMFERIVNLGRQEAVHLAAEDTEGLAAVLSEREEAINAFIQAGPGEKREAFLDKLTKLQDMNARLRHETKALHHSPADDLGTGNLTAEQGHDHQPGGSMRRL